MLQPIAAKILMKVLYGARMARFDLLRAVCQLATQFTKWDAYCDKRLHRIMCYIKSTVNLKMVGWVGDDADNITPVLFADADFAGCLKTARFNFWSMFGIARSFNTFPVTSDF